MSIDEMQAGREMDALVAEKVMGWKKSRLLHNIVNNYRLENPKGNLEIPPPYSTDIAAFKIVIDKMIERGFHWIIKTPFTPDDYYFSGLTPIGVTGWNGKPDFSASGDSIMDTGCRTALKAMEARQ